MSIADLVATGLIAVGLFFLLVAGVGILRLPDLFSRLHVTGVIDTLGVPLVLAGVAVHLGPRLVSGKLILATLFLAVTSPLVGHLLARAAIEAGKPPTGKD
ncbi:MAG TPA: monovalent cation/H(+) antiporter subunit G [Gemmatimonadaceae bacterium]|nr:monovalent cation/H(+) antiporter subunit G [Gemmatimonadaceae bacterium]HRQ78905.1 monovalent cation/H(+) antiporter subunit G [Gemmatimonadaceae bacterium]